MSVPYIVMDTVTPPDDRYTLPTVAFSTAQWHHSLPYLIPKAILLINKLFIYY